MRTAGIIMECNPFHAGHQYIIETARKIAGGDGAVIVAMSGNFAQRGIPAVQAREVRARQALAAGADLILELPVRYAVSGAEYFARGGVSLLLRTGLVTDLVFGSECGDLDRLQRSAEFLCAEPEDFRRLLRENLSSGMSWPLARAKAAAQCRDAVDLPDSPNDLLAVEYLKELQQLQNGTDAVRSHAITRIPGRSASALREELRRKDQGVFPDDFSGMLLDKLLTIDRGVCRYALTDYEGVSADLAHRIRRLLPRFVSWTQFCSLLKTRNLTSTTVNRALTHILLDITSDMLPSVYPSAQNTLAADGLQLSAIMPYARVLGCRRSALPLLGDIRRQGLVLITSRADADRFLPSGTRERILLESDLHASETWEYAARIKQSEKAAAEQKAQPEVPISEFSRPLLIFPGDC